MVESVLDHAGGIEQFQFDVVIVCPALEVGQHAQSAALNGAHFRKGNHDHS